MPPEKQVGIEFDELIYEEGEIKITKNIAKIHEKTFFIKNIGSLAIDTPMNINAPFTFIGASFIWANIAENKITPITSVIIGFIWLIYEIKMYRLTIVSGGGEVSAYQNTNKLHVEKIHNAILNAITKHNQP